MDSSRIIGNTVHKGEFGVLECTKQRNGFTWSITSLIQPEWLHQDLQNLQRTASRRQLIFKANPRIMKIPWKLTETGQPQTGNATAEQSEITAYLEPQEETTTANHRTAGSQSLAGHMDCRMPRPNTKKTMGIP